MKGCHRLFSSFFIFRKVWENILIFSMLNKERKKRKKGEGGNGFEKWGGYMNAKISKLEAQFREDQKVELGKDGNKGKIFNGIAIFVNGFTEPSADELRFLMLEHGGVYHHYYRSGKTTHIIASSLPNAKFDQMKTLKVVRCEWITESIKAGKLLDYKNYLLQNNFGNLIKPSNAAGPLLNVKEMEVPKTAADDGYLNDFYKNSRLHYISKLGAMLKNYVQELRDSHNGIFPGRKHLQQIQEPMDVSLDLETGGSNIIMHIDMDCFFVAVALRNQPHLKGQPVAVTHSKGKPAPEERNVNRKFEMKFYRKKMKAKLKSKEESSDSDDDSIDEWAGERSSMSEVASCSYEARKMGVRKGMYLGMALKLCPNLKTVPYDFEGYREVSLTLYNTVAEYTLDIEAISCDELFMDCSNLLTELKINPMKFAEILRGEIEKRTKCTSSIGIGTNKLQARLATKHAKPNGQFHLSLDNVGEFMKNLDVGELPGVGRTICAKLKSLSVRTCEDLQKLSLASLKKEFGEKTGEALYKHCRGEDDRKVNSSHERKSVSAEVNYGIRFNDSEETEKFLKQLSEEVSKRLKDVKMMGKNLTFKVMYRAKDAPVETAKFLGHGACDIINRSVALPFASDNPQIIARHIIGVYHQLGIPPNELRGIGIQVTKLEAVKKTPKTLQDFLNKRSKPPDPSEASDHSKNVVTLQPPSASQIDLEVLTSLPENIREEILKDYGLNNLVKEKDIEKEKVDHPSKSEENMEEKLLGLSVGDVRKMIKEWVATELHPKSYDAVMLISYLRRLVEKKKLETAYIIVKCLNRHIRSQRAGNDAWKGIYQSVIEAVQDSMRKTFGKLLACDAV